MIFKKVYTPETFPFLFGSGRENLKRGLELLINNLLFDQGALLPSCLLLRSQQGGIKKNISMF